MRGDLTLVDEIMHTDKLVNEDAKQVMLQDVPLPSLQLSSTEKRCREAHMLLDLQERNFNFQVKRMKFIEEMFGMDDRDKLYYKDLLKKSSDNGYAVIQDTEDERGREISIALVCQEMGVNPRTKVHKSVG